MTEHDTYILTSASQTMKQTFLTRLLLLLFLCMFLIGCSHYYKVTDPISGKTYYTDDLKKKDGGLELTDAGTGQSVRIQNYELKEIDEYEFQSGRARAGRAVE